MAKSNVLFPLSRMGMWPSKVDRRSAGDTGDTDLDVGKTAFMREGVDYVDVSVSRTFALSACVVDG